MAFVHRDDVGTCETWIHLLWGLRTCFLAARLDSGDNKTASLDSSPPTSANMFGDFSLREQIIGPTAGGKIVL